MAIFILKHVTIVSKCVAIIMGIDIRMLNDHIIPIKPLEKLNRNQKSKFWQMYHFLICKLVTFVSFIVNNFGKLVTVSYLMYQIVLLICARSIHL